MEQTFAAIDKSSPIPASHQIYADLRSRIISGAWKENDLLPSENALVSLYATSRITVRQALAELQKDDYIVKVKGLGSIVKARPLQVVHDFSLPSTLCAKLGQKGISLDTKLINMECRSPLPGINEALKLGSEERLISITQLFLRSGQPIALNDSWIAERNVPDILSKGLVEYDISATLSQSYHLVPVRIENSLESIIATSSDIIQLLDIQPAAPLICVNSVTYLPFDVPLEYSRTIWRSDRVRFHFGMDLKTQNL